MRASVIVVSHAGLERLEDSIASLEPEAARRESEVILVDNACPGGTAEAASRRWPWVRVVRSDVNLGFAGGVNLGADAADGDVLVLLNDDAAAEDGFVDAHLQVLDAHPRAAATAGRLISWDRARHDFVCGAVTFDVHAFQVGQGWPVAEHEPPPVGEPLPFACGGNLAIRRDAWRELGGFDPGLFAYFEDVDLGWRLWAFGHEVVAAPGAVARHRGGATSSGLGDFRRGVLFERNALRTFFACADDEHRAALGPAVYATFLHRLSAFARADRRLAPVAADPFGEAPPPPSRAERWRRRLNERGVLGSARHLAARLLLGPGVGAPRVDDGHLLMQLRAADGFFAGLEATEARRRAIARRRRVPDRDILGRFPRLVVPTYPGDDEWFASEAFRSLLPEGWPLEDRRLDRVIHPSLIRS
ncbi:MAG TPA: glycosyltransferase family 2 protein [Candidatus Sulfomarinibacteraceae bacterium]|nr:glycosyltransferase family 2 protein [Candidatus Sulfomarinibacteraceae bacterium]